MSVHNFHWLDHGHNFFAREYAIREVFAFIQIVKKYFSCVLMIRFTIHIVNFWPIELVSNFSWCAWCLRNTNITCFLKRSYMIFINQSAFLVSKKTMRNTKNCIQNRTHVNNEIYELTLPLQLQTPFSFLICCQAN